MGWVDPLGLDEKAIVRRFDSRKNIKNIRKNGIKYDSSIGSGIPTASTDIDPINPDKIKKALGARSAEEYVDIDITNKKTLIRKTKSGHKEIVVQENIDKDDILYRGKVQKSVKSKKC